MVEYSLLGAGRGHKRRGLAGWAGRIFRIRETLLHGMPEDVRLKKLAARCASMAQAGQYNYTRCLRHGEDGAAMLAAGEYVSSAVDAIYLLNRRHKPYYKWPCGE